MTYFITFALSVLTPFLAVARSEDGELPFPFLLLPAASLASETASTGVVPYSFQ